MNYNQFGQNQKKPDLIPGFGNLIHQKIDLCVEAVLDGKTYEVCMDKIGLFEKGFNFEKKDKSGK